MKSRCEPDGAANVSRNPVAQTGSLPCRGLAIRSCLRIRRSADCQSADTAGCQPALQKNGSLPFFRHPAYFNPMTRKATGLLPGLGQTSVRLNS